MPPRWGPGRSAPPSRPPLPPPMVPGAPLQPPPPPNPYHLNRPERDQLQDLVQATHYGVDPSVLFGLAEGLIGTAGQRYSTRQEGLSQLRQLAMELAAGTASEDAVAAAVTGQADLLPGVNPQSRAMAGLEGFVSGLYDEGPVSGLAPYDVRSQFAGTLDQEDRGIVGQLVVQGLEEGTPFRDIRERVRKTMVAAGYDEFAMSEAVNEAELAYERLIGTSLEDLRSFGMDLREGIIEAGGNSEELEPGVISEVTGLPEEDVSLLGGTPTTESFLAQLVNDPQLYQRLRSGFQSTQQEAPSSFGGGFFGRIRGPGGFIPR